MQRDSLQMSRPNSDGGGSQHAENSPVELGQAANI